MSLSSDKHNTMFDLASKVDQSSAVPLSPPPLPQEDREVKLSNKRKHSPIPEYSEKALSHGQGSLLETTKWNAYLPLTVKRESPWGSYRKEFSCDLAGHAAVVIHKREPSKVLLLRSYPAGIADKMLQWFTQLRHPNIMSAKECFTDKTSLHVLCEDLPLTLEHLIVCRAYPTEARLALIMRQILAGLSYLLAAGLEHQSLKSSNILMSLDGGVKLGSLEDVHRRDPHRDQSETLKALKTITMELMEKHTRKKNSAGVNDLKRWPPDSKAVKFLAATEGVSSVNELEKHPLITECRETEGELVGLARLALISARTFYACP